MEGMIMTAQLLLSLSILIAVHEGGHFVAARMFDIKVEKLNEYDMGHLHRLKDWIYQTRIKSRLEKDKSERKQQKEQEEQQGKDAQPTLFDF